MGTVAMNYTSPIIKTDNLTSLHMEEMFKSQGWQNPWRLNIYQRAVRGDANESGSGWEEQKIRATDSPRQTITIHTHRKCKDFS